MIKIIKGVYGHQVGKSVQPKNADSEPFSLEAEQEARLVARGVAEYVANPSEPKQLPEEDSGDGLGDGKFPTYNKSMKTERLKEIALIYGVSKESLATAKNRGDIVALIDEAKRIAAGVGSPDAGAGENPDNKNDPPAPSFSAAEPVQ